MDRVQLGREGEKSQVSQRDLARAAGDCGKTGRVIGRPG
jgi:hypothetical protein